MKFIFGQESYFINSDIKRIINKADVEATIYDETTPFEEIEIDITTIGMFSSEKLIIIKNHEMLNDDKQGERMVAILENLNPEVEIVFSLVQDKINKNKPLIKFLMKNAECKNYPLVSENKIVTIIHDIVKSKGGTISNSAAIQISIKLPNNLLLIVRELDKLLMENKDITTEMVKKSIGEYQKDDYFALSNAIIDGNPEGIISAFQDKVKNGEEMTRILSNISQVLSLAAEINSYLEQGYTQMQIADSMKIHQFRVKKSIELIQRSSGKEINNLLIELAKLDRDIKSGKVDPEMGPNLFILNLIK